MNRWAAMRWAAMRWVSGRCWLSGSVRRSRWWESTLLCCVGVCVSWGGRGRPSPRSRPTSLVRSPARKAKLGRRRSCAATRNAPWPAPAKQSRSRRNWNGCPAWPRNSPRAPSPPKLPRLIAEAAAETPVDQNFLLDAAEQQADDLFRRTLKHHINERTNDEELQARRDRQRRRRRASISEEPDGMFNLFARLDPLAGARLRGALSAKADELFRAEDPQQRATPQQRLADALEQLACHPNTNTTGGRPPDAELVVLADYDAIHDKLVNAGLVDGTRLTETETLAIACDASILPGIFNKLGGCVEPHRQHHPRPNPPQSQPPPPQTPHHPRPRLHRLRRPPQNLRSPPHRTLGTRRANHLRQHLPPLLALPPHPRPPPRRTSHPPPQRPLHPPTTNPHPPHAPGPPHTEQASRHANGHHTPQPPIDAPTRAGPPTATGGERASRHANGRHANGHHTPQPPIAGHHQLRVDAVGAHSRPRRRQRVQSAALGTRARMIVERSTPQWSAHSTTVTPVSNERPAQATRTASCARLRSDAPTRAGHHTPQPPRAGPNRRRGRTSQPPRQRPPHSAAVALSSLRGVRRVTGGRHRRILLASESGPGSTPGRAVRRNDSRWDPSTTSTQGQRPRSPPGMC